MIIDDKTNLVKSLHETLQSVLNKIKLPLIRAQQSKVQTGLDSNSLKLGTGEHCKHAKT